LGLWRRHQHKPDVGKLYQSKLLFAQQILSEFLKAHPHNTLPVTFDNWYTQPAFCRFLDKTLKVPYVGTLSSDDLVVLKQGPQRVETFDAHLQHEHHQAIKDGGQPVFRALSIPYFTTIHFFSTKWLHRIAQASVTLRLKNAPGI